MVIFHGLIGLAYIIVLGITITGLLKLVFKENTSLKIIHKFAVPPAILLWIMSMYGAQAIPQKPVLRVLLLTLFLLLVFGSSLTGWLMTTRIRRVGHMIFGGITFLAFTYFIFFFILANA